MLDQLGPREVVAQDAAVVAALERLRARAPLAEADPVAEAAAHEVVALLALDHAPDLRAAQVGGPQPLAQLVGAQLHLARVELDAQVAQVPARGAVPGADGEEPDGVVAVALQR